MKNLAYIYCIIAVGIGYTQTPPDTTLRTLKTPAVEVISRQNAAEIQRMSTTSGTVIVSEEIQQKSPEDLGDLTNSFSGVFVRSYGGAGGLKTLNARGLGSQHFLVVNNQQALIFNQMGSANLGEIQTDGLQSVVYSVGGNDSWDVPTLAKTYSGVLHVKYKELNSNVKDFVHIQSLGGSFGRYKLTGSWLKSSRRAIYFAQGYGYHVKGDFPYVYKHGLVYVDGLRLHNLTTEYAARFGMNYLFRDYSKLQFSTQYLSAYRELPGAIVFYHPENFQTLRNLQINGSIRHEYARSKLQLLNYANYSRTQTDYRDSFHLVIPQWQEYNENNTDFGHNGRMDLSRLKVNWSAQYILSSLSSNRAAILFPKRHRTLIQAGLEYYFDGLKLRLDFPLQAVSDQIIHQVNQNRILFTPSLGFRKIWSKDFNNNVLRGSVGQFSRLATFSEMYYGQIGNPELRPEISQMINLGFHHKRGYKQMNLGFGLDAFYGRIKDKIIAIPTQNLFVWSIRNLQTVSSIGFDAILNFEITPKNSKARMQFIQKSSLNIAQDRSNPSGPTFGHQIPYTPFWLHQSEVSVLSKKLSVSYTYSFNDFRFVLGENIAANVLDAFHLHDIRFSYAMQSESNKHHLKFHLKINNLFNVQYQVMRGFPMPGRNFEIGISWKR